LTAAHIAGDLGHRSMLSRSSFQGCSAALVSADFERVMHTGSVGVMALVERSASLLVDPGFH